MPIPPGGAPDVAARLIGQYLSESLGQPVVIENRTGANGNIAGEAVAKAAPDGYTLLLAADSGIVINPHVYAKMPFDPLKDLVPISSVATNQFILAINPKVPAKTLPEFVDYARKANPPLAFASGGVGSQQHFAMELLKQRAGINLLSVTYRGGAAGDGRDHCGRNAGAVRRRRQRRTIRGRQPARARGQRQAALEDGSPICRPSANSIPATRSISGSACSRRPARPEPIVAKLHKEVQALLARPDVAEKINVSGSLEPLILSPEDFSALIRRDYDKYGRLVKEFNIKIN